MKECISHRNILSSKNESENAGSGNYIEELNKAWVLLAALLLLGFLGLSIWKIPYGIAISDETLYLSIPYRMVQGDDLLLHEWHVSQMSAILLAPLLRLYLEIVGNTEEIILAFRGIFLAFHTLTALYLFLLLRRRSFWGALSASMMYLIYVPMNIMALSYNTMGIGLLAVVFVTLACGRGRLWEATLCGLCFAGAVLCNPYYFLLYILYSSAVLLFALRHCGRQDCLRGRFWLCLTAAGALAALAAGASVIRIDALPLYAKTIPEILWGDTAEHPARTLPGILYGIWASFHKNGLFLPTVAASVCLCAARGMDRKWRTHKALYLAVAALLTLAYGLWFRVFSPVSLNYYMFPLSILGFFAWLFSDDLLDRLFWFVYLPGLICWFCSAAASNLGFLNIASLATLNMLAGAVLIFETIPMLFRTDRWGKAAALLMAAAVLVQLGLLAECRVRTVYPMQPVSAQTETVEHGALRGLRVEPEEKTRYEQAWLETQAVREAPGVTVAYLSDVPGQYLDDTKRCGVFSPWFPGVSASDNLPRLLRYWELFPERLPDYIVIDLDDPGATELVLQAMLQAGFRATDKGVARAACMER